MRFPLVLVLEACLIAAGCGPSDTTGDFALGDSQREFNAFDPGTMVWLPAGDISRTAGEPATLTAIDAIGLPQGLPATSVVLDTQLGELGLFPRDAIDPERLALSRPLAGASLAPGDRPLAIYVEVTVPDDGLTVTGFRLHYQIVDETRSIYLPYSDRVCTPRSADCAFPETP